MTTFAEIRTKVSTDLRDVDGKFFDAGVIGDMVNAALTEVGRIAPERFQEDITPVADTLRYVVRSDIAGGVTPEIELTTCEIWDGSTVPATRTAHLQPLSAQPVNDTQNGWRMWGGYLELPVSVVTQLVPATDLIRVWGYAPYPVLVNDADVLATSSELTQAVRDYCTIEGLKRLTAGRAVFTQWQTRTNNTDISPAMLVNDLAQAESNWKTKARAIYVIREAPG